jgi:microcystin-dependent protein
MTDPFMGEIRAFPFYWPPKGWTGCDGALMPISQNTALFSLLGTVYGGDGKSTFALPDLVGRTPMTPGTGPGLSPRSLGEMGGTDTITLLQSEIPAHTHAVNVMVDDANERQPPGQAFAPGNGIGFYQDVNGQTALAAPEAVTPAGGGLPHNNLMPYLTLNFCISLFGVYPPRS